MKDFFADKSCSYLVAQLVKYLKRLLVNKSYVILIKMICLQKISMVVDEIFRVVEILTRIFNQIILSAAS
jgi:hypothetical protein